MRSPENQLPRLFQLSLLVATILCLQAPAQPQPSPTAQTQTAPAESETTLLVDQLIENATLNRAALPSLTAHESIASKRDEGLLFRKTSDQAEATVRLVRRSPDSPNFTEVRQITSLNNKPVAPDRHARLQYNFTNDFDDFQSMIFNTRNRNCYTYTLAPHPDPAQPLILSLTGRADQTTPGRMGEHRDIAATVRIDPATRQITHLESTIVDTPITPTSDSRFLAVDYAPTRVSDKTFWLPTTVDAHFVQEKHRWQSHSRYSDYHLYTSTVKILPDPSTP